MENSFNFEQASYGDLYNEAKRLNALVESLETKHSRLEVALANRNRQFVEGSGIAKELIEENIVTDEDYIVRLVEVFGLEIMKEVTFTVSIEVTGTTQIPIGSELDEYSFSIDSLSYNGEDVSVESDSYTLDGWEFTE